MHNKPWCRALVDDLLYYSQWAGAFDAGKSVAELAAALSIPVGGGAWQQGQQDVRAHGAPVLRLAAQCCSWGSSADIE